MGKPPLWRRVVRHTPRGDLRPETRGDEWDTGETTEGDDVAAIPILERPKILRFNLGNPTIKKIDMTFSDITIPISYEIRRK